jgi:uncharacterized membrane protein
MQLFLVKRIWTWLEKLVKRVPLINSIYDAFRDLFGFFSSNAAENASRIKQHPFCNFGYPVIAFSSSKTT